ncbi:MAG: hypothetical protein HKN19_15825 [Halioglobus sp.]|nr:hypothetical protein [Halioglobus sp.]
MLGTLGLPAGGRSSLIPCPRQYTWLHSRTPPNWINSTMQLTRPPLVIGRNEPCFCGSGERFRRCCGSSQPDRKPPMGIVVEENFLGADDCAAILDVARARGSSRLKLMDEKNSTAETVVRRYDDNRITQRVDMSGHQAMLDEPVLRAIRSRIEPAMNCRVEWFEEPHILQYEPGGFYACHADSENLDKSSNLWERVLDRDVSLLLYLDDEYEGGELEFANFDYTLRPRAGMLVFFPSDSRYRHAALPVTAGMRHAIVSWMSLHGVEKLRSIPSDATRLP